MSWDIYKIPKNSLPRFLFRISKIYTSSKHSIIHRIFTGTGRTIEVFHKMSILVHRLTLILFWIKLLLMKKAPHIRPHELIQHKTKRHVSIKFLLLLAALLVYFGWLSWHYGFATGGLVSVITWSFFVLCTPIADAGFLIDFPLRLLFRVRMWMSEIFVWGVAISIAGFSAIFSPEVFETTEVTSLFLKIITTPWPFWLIVLLSGTGTFLSIKFGDELLDCVEHHERVFHQKHKRLYHLILMAGFLVLIFWGYGHLLTKLGVTLSMI